MIKPSFCGSWKRVQARISPNSPCLPGHDEKWKSPIMQQSVGEGSGSPTTGPALLFIIEHRFTQILINALHNGVLHSPLFKNTRSFQVSLSLSLSLLSYLLRYKRKMHCSQPPWRKRVKLCKALYCLHVNLASSYTSHGCLQHIWDMNELCDGIS